MACSCTGLSENFHINLDEAQNEDTEDRCVEENKGGGDGANTDQKLAHSIHGKEDPTRSLDQSKQEEAEEHYFYMREFWVKTLKTKERKTKARHAKAREARKSRVTS